MKSFPLLLALMIFQIITHRAAAQSSSYYDEKTDKEYVIDASTDGDVVDRYLEQNDFKAIEFNPDTNSFYNFRIQLSSSDWVLHNSSHLDFFSEKKHAINFPSSLFGSLEYPVTTARKGNKLYFYSLLEHQIVDDFWFEDVVYFKTADTSFNWNFELQKHEYEINYRFYGAVKRKQSWAMVYFDMHDHGELFFQVTPFCYASLDELPKKEIAYMLREINDWEAKGLNNQVVILRDLLIEKEYTDIQFDTSIPLQIRLKDKKGDWSLYGPNFGLLARKGYRIQFSEYECGDITIAEHDDQKQFISLELYEREGVFEQHPVLFDNYRFHYQEEYIQMLDPETGDLVVDNNGNILFDTIQYCDYISIERAGKWAMLYYSSYESKFFQLTGFGYEDPDEIPGQSIKDDFNLEADLDVNVAEEKMKSVSDFLFNNNEFDHVSYVGPYGFGDILKVRHGSTKRWSLITTHMHTKDTELPIGVDTLKEHAFNEHTVFEVRCGNNVGYHFYNSDSYALTKIFPCEFDDFEYVFLDYTYGCALKKDGMWSLYKPSEPTKMVEGKAKTIDSLMSLWLNR